MEETFFCKPCYKYFKNIRNFQTHTEFIHNRFKEEKECRRCGIQQQTKSCFYKRENGSFFNICKSCLKYRAKQPKIECKYCLKIFSKHNILHYALCVSTTTKPHIKKGFFFFQIRLSPRKSFSERGFFTIHLTCVSDSENTILFTFVHFQI